MDKKIPENAWDKDDVAQLLADISFIGMQLQRIADTLENPNRKEG